MGQGMKVTKAKFRFHGGVHPPYNKELARGKAIERMPMPSELVVSMSQHLGAPAKCVGKALFFGVIRPKAVSLIPPLRFN